VIRGKDKERIGRRLRKDKRNPETSLHWNVAVQGSG